MTKKQLFKQIRNGKQAVCYSQRHYTIVITYRDELYHLNTYFFGGNDISDEANYKDEQNHLFENYNDLIAHLKSKFELKFLFTNIY